ncbi:hypothetical protein FHS16_006086 [Paenibacillus endophyticus]|uniref:Uncharacterized protein n=1 Tax=Paenibacillus endophyticus TaxID=1294268 RepID=A0A7W5CEU4_9BACL|nr:hypothetical protein [Paenibacillus endophyticus]MBB3155970.1 hypothetical protein [Paenibacillus endophyticus]
MEALRKLVRDRFAEIKVKQIAAREAGIVENISYIAATNGQRLNLTFFLP